MIILVLVGDLMKKHLTLLIFLTRPLLECLKIGRLPAPPIVATQGPWSEVFFKTKCEWKFCWNKVWSENIFKKNVWVENSLKQQVGGDFQNKVWMGNFKVHLSSPVELSPLDNHCETCIGSSGCKWRSLQQKDWTYLFCTFCNKRIEKKKFCRFCNKRIQHFGLHILKHKDWTYLFCIFCNKRIEHICFAHFATKGLIFFCIFCNKRIEHICFAHFAIWESSGDVALTDICFEQLAIWESYDGTRGKESWFSFEIFWMGWIETVAPLWLET